MPETEPKSNPVVESYRKWVENQGMRENRSNDELTQMLGDAYRERGRTDIEENYPEFREQYLTERREDAPGVLTEIGRGIKRGVQQGGVALGAVTEMGAETLGLEGLAESASEFTENRVMDLQQIEGPSVASHRDIRTGGDIVRWLAGHAGQMMPETAAMAGTSLIGAGVGTLTAGPAGTAAGGVGTAIATRVLARKAIRELVEEGVERTVAKTVAKQVANLATDAAKRKALRGAATKAGALAGGFLPMEVSYVGDLYNTATEQGATHGDAMRSALLFGTPAAMVETIYPARFGALMLRKLASEGGEEAAKRTIKQKMRSILKEAGVGASTEGSAEAMAEAFTIAGEAMAIPGYELNPEAIRSRLEHALVAGSALGAIGGGIAGAVPTIQTEGRGQNEEGRSEEGGNAQRSTPEGASKIDAVVDRFMEATEEPAVVVDLGQQVAAEIQQTPPESRTPEEQEYIDWWSENFERIEKETRSEDALARLNAVLGADEIIGQQDVRLRERQPKMFDTPLVEPGAAADPFAMPTAPVRRDPMLVEGADPADPAQIVTGSPINARRETTVFSQPVDEEILTALNDATAVDDDPFAPPTSTPMPSPIPVENTSLNTSPDAPISQQVTDSQGEEIVTQNANQIRPLLTDFNPDGTITPVQLRTELLPMPRNTSTLVEGAGEPGATASATRNFVAVQMPDGTVETRGVFPSSQGPLAHNKVSRTTVDDVAQAADTTKTEVSKTLKHFRETGELRGRTDRVRERSQRIVDSAQELRYEEGRRHVKVETLLKQEGVQPLGFFQTESVPPQMIQQFANRAEFEAAFGETASVSRAQRGGLAEFVGADPERATLADVAERSGTTVEDARRVLRNESRLSEGFEGVDAETQAAVRQAAEELGYGKSRDVPIKSAEDTGPGIDIESTVGVAEDAPDVGHLYGKLQQWEASDTLVSRIGGVAGVHALGRLNPDQVRKRLTDEIVQVAPASARVMWDDANVPAESLPQIRAMRNQMLDGLYSDLRQMAAKGVFYRRPRADAHRASDARMQQRFADLTAWLARNGIALEVANPNEAAADSFWHGEGGRFIPTNRTVQIAIEDVVNPTARNLRDLHHEAAHDLFSREPEGIRNLLHDMIARMDPADLSFYGEPTADWRLDPSNPASLEPRVFTEEMLVEHLTYQGVERETARSLVRQLIDAVKELLLKAALRFQQAFELSEPISDWLAREYIETRWQRFLDGTPMVNAESWLGKLGGRKLQYSEEGHFFTLSDEGGFTQTIDPRTGGVEPGSVLNDSSLAMEHNRQAIIAASEADTIHARDAEMQAAEILMRRESEQAGLVLYHKDGESRARQLSEVRRQELQRKLQQNAMVSIAENNTVSRFIDRTLDRVRQQEPGLNREALLRRMKIAEDPLELARIESRKQDEYGDPVSAELTLEDLTTEARSRAEMQALVRIHKIEADLSTRIATKSREAQETTERLQAKQERFSDLAENVADIKQIERQTRAALIDSITNLIRAVKAQSQGDHAAGRTSGALQAILEINEGQKLSDNFSKLLRNLVTSDVPIFSYVRQLRRLSRDTLDFETHTPKEIRQAVIAEVKRGNKDMEPLTNGERGTALLSLLIEFVKKETHLAAAMEVQKMDATIREAVVSDIRRMLRDRTETGFEEMAQRARAMPRSAQNDAIIAFANLRREMKSMAGRIDRATKSRIAAQEGLKEATALAGELEARHGVGAETLFVDGEQVLVPAKPDATSEEISAPVEEDMDSPHFKTFRTAEEDATTNAEKIRWVTKMKAFLEHRETSGEPGAKDRIYWKVKRQAEAMGRVVLEDVALPYQKGFLDSARQSISTNLRRLGVPGAKMAASMFERRQAIVKPNERKTQVLGFQWETLESKFRKRAKVTREFYRDAIYNPSMHWLSNESLRDRESSLTALRSVLSDNPKVRAALDRPGAWEAFVQLVDKTDEANRWFRQEVLEKEGLSIRDDSLGKWFNPVTKRTESYTRSLVDGGVLIVPRSLSGSTRTALIEMNRRGWWKSKTDLRNFTKRISEMPEQTRAQLQEMVTPHIQANFIEPLILNDAGILLDRPAKAGELKLKADPAYVAEAWEASGGDLMDFAERLYALHTGKADPEGVLAYAAQVVETLGNEFVGMLEGHAQDLQADTGTRITVDQISYASLNARTAHHLPSQFFTYERFGPHDNRFRLEQVANQAVFGRDFKQLFELYGRIENDLKLRKSALEAARADLIRETPDLATDPKAMDKALRERMGREYELAQNIDDALRSYNAQALTDATKGIFKGPSGITGDVQAIQHIMNLIVGMLVNNPKTALMNMTSNNDPMRLFGVNRETFLAAAGAWSSSAKQGAATLLSAFGKNILLHNEKWMQMQAAGLHFDHATETSWREMTGQHGPMAQWDEQGKAGKVKKAVAITTDFVMNTTINPAGVNQQAIAFRPLAPFTMLQHISNRSTAYGVIVGYELMARKIAKFYQKRPAAMNDPDYQVKPEDIGMTSKADRMVFEKMADQARLNGFTMEDIGRQAAMSQNPKQFPFDHDTIRKMGVMAVNHVSMESNPTNRPAWSFSNLAGRISIPLIGWSLESFNTTTSMTRDAQGRRDLRTAMVGLAGLLLVVTPIAIAYSVAFDEYDRRLLGKQPNIRPLTSADPKEMALGLIERINAMGVFGLGGEALVGTINLGDSTGQRVLSVDERVVWLNTFGRLQQTIGTIIAQGGLGNTTYASTWRGLFQGTVGAGPIQAMQMTNTLLGHPPIPGLQQEGAVTQRINVQNWLRAQGRNMGMEIRKAGGFARPTPVTPHVTSMQLAAFQDDPEAFGEAYRRAIEEARKLSHVEDPRDHVRRSFQSRHPLRNVYRTPPSPSQYQALLDEMPAIGREAVSAAITNYNRYGQRLGITPYVGSEGRTASSSSGGGFASSFESGFTGGFESALQDAFSVGF